VERRTSRNYVITVPQLICRDISHQHVCRSVADIDRDVRRFQCFLRRDSARPKKQTIFSYATLVLKVMTRSENRSSREDCSPAYLSGSSVHSVTPLNGDGKLRFHTIGFNNDFKQVFC